MYKWIKAPPGRFARTSRGATALACPDVGAGSKNSMHTGCERDVYRVSEGVAPEGIRDAPAVANRPRCPRRYPVIHSKVAVIHKRLPSGGHIWWAVEPAAPNVGAGKRVWMSSAVGERHFVQMLADELHFAADGYLFVHQCCDLVAGVDDGRVVAAAQQAGDL